MIVHQEADLVIDRLQRSAHRHTCVRSAILSEAVGGEWHRLSKNTAEDESGCECNAERCHRIGAYIFPCAFEQLVLGFEHFIALHAELRRRRSGCRCDAIYRLMSA